MDKLFEFLRYPTTWQGIIGLLALLGVHLSPEQTTVIVEAALGVISALALFFSDSDVPPKA